MAALLLLALGVSLVLTVARLLGLPLPPLLLGLACGLGVAILSDRWRRRGKGRGAEGRSARLRVLSGGRAVGGNYDLAKDRSTDSQRWLM
jgi:hypothetical protein